VDIARKYHGSISIAWTAPLFLCGNTYLTYEDSGGSLSRRLALFRFDKYVDRKDSQLEAKIIASELPALVTKSLRA
jgi:phage/plasmid-associated DNA primase